MEGQSTLDNSFITGEALPKEVFKGSNVLAGAINIESKLTLKTLKIGSDSRLGNIFKEIEKEQAARTSMEDRANKLSAHFVLAVFIIATLTYFVWNLIDPTRAFDITVSFLIVTCPCALGLAIPAAVTISLGRARKRGIFIRRPNAFESLVDTDNFYFDKTGTLSAGQIAVRKTFGQNASLLQIANTLAGFAPLHPIAKAIEDFSQNKNSIIQKSQIQDCKYFTGRGVQGILADGTVVRLGSLRWLTEEGVQFNEAQKKQLEEFQKEGNSISILALDSKVNLIFALADQLALGSKELIEYLKEQGKQIFILSGDSQGAVNSIADALNIERDHAIGELFPEQKSAILSEDKKANCMIGDGLNDAPAMKQSDISVGLRGGIEATIEVASLYISSGSLADLLDLLKASKKTISVIQNNITYAIAYNIVGGSLAVSGYVNPIVAAILMPLSSLTIISYSLLIKTFKKS
jgi:Cu2+-exporting ATPase